MDDIVKQNRYENDCYIGNAVWGFYYPGEAHERWIFSERVLLPFEDKDYYAPCGYDEYLRRLYGDYEIDPSPEKQATHHTYTAYYKDK